tara:strand:+ start:3332 stop:3811 length:480 start_codon:yes stop_codon:yes gene_type:complete
MTQKKRKIIKIGIIVLLAGLLIGGGAVIYMFNMPHRNVQSASTDFNLSASQIITEFLDSPSDANEKYLADDGDSKILEITGIVKKISIDFNNQKVVLLQSDADKAGVSCSFTQETSKNVSEVKIGESITIKGVIRAGAAYDEDLEMYENVILEKGDLVN